MKKGLLFVAMLVFILALSFTVTSCKDAIDPEIVGKWYLSQALADAEGDEFLYEFKADGKFLIGSMGEGISMTYTADKGVITITTTFQGESVSGTAEYTINGTSLKISKSETKCPLVDGTVYKKK